MAPILPCSPTGNCLTKCDLSMLCKLGHFFAIYSVCMAIEISALMWGNADGLSLITLNALMRGHPANGTNLGLYAYQMWQKNESVLIQRLQQILWDSSFFSFQFCWRYKLMQNKTFLMQRRMARNCNLMQNNSFAYDHNFVHTKKYTWQPLLDTIVPFVPSCSICTNFPYSLAQLLLIVQKVLANQCCYNK